MTFRSGTLGSLLFGCTVLLASGCSGPSVSEEPQKLGKQGAELYVSSGEIWPTTTIPVCWNDTGSDMQKEWVRSAVRATWERETGIQFSGWRTCPTAGSAELRIQISDEQPHTVALGSSLIGKLPGMVLNFTFNGGWDGMDWCHQDLATLRYCIQTIAVHEFGHALGLAHEQNRDDTPYDCTAGAQGSDGDINVGEWDYRSVMNYCNIFWNDNGALSARDVDGIRKYYGRPILHFAGVDPRGGLFYTNGTQGGLKAKLQDVEALAGDIGTPVDVDIAEAGRNLHLVATNSAGQVKHTIRREDGTWQAFGNLANGTFTRVSAASTSTWVSTLGSPGGLGDELQVCATKSDGTLWHQIRKTDGSWTGFGNVTNAVGSNPGAFVDVDCARVNDDMQLVGVTSDGKVWLTKRPRVGGWTPWEDVRAAVGSSDPGPVKDVSITEFTEAGTASEWGYGSTVVVTTNTGKQYYAYRAALGVWTPFAALPVPKSGAPVNSAAVRFQNELVVASSDGNQAAQATFRQNGTWDTHYRSITGKFDRASRISLASGGVRNFGELTRQNPAATVFNFSLEQKFLTGDFNGDGLTDMFQVYRLWGSIPTCTWTGTGWSCQNLLAQLFDAGSPEEQFLAGDFNADGKTDIVQTYRGWGSIPTCLSTGSSWSCQNLPATISDSGSAGQRFMTGDFDGDGKTDVVQTYAGWDQTVNCLSTGSAWNCSTLPASIDHTGGPRDQFLTGDFDGDGKTDLAQLSPTRGGSIPTCLSTGTGWSCSNPSATVYDSGNSNQQALVGDVNGDGKSDIIQLFGGSATTFAWGSIPVCFSTGTGWNCENRPANLFSRPEMPPSDVQWVVADMNGDHRMDIVEGFAGWSNYQICYAGDTTWNCDSQATDLYDSLSWTQTLFAANLDGDGRPDLVRAYEGWGSYPVDLNNLLR